VIIGHIDGVKGENITRLLVHEGKELGAHDIDPK
jgi:hypothetical protein